MDKIPSLAVLDYYRTPAGATSLPNYRSFCDDLKPSIRVIFQVVQGLLIHDAWMNRYGETSGRPRRCDSNIYIEHLLDKALELDGRALTLPRSPEHRIIGCCRDFTTLFVAILRQKGIPARARCGFATYLAPAGYYEDHWVAEYWNEDESRWVKIDPQMDPFQESFLKLDFDPLDVPDDRFLVGGKAWGMCRKQQAHGDQFGISADPSWTGLKSLYGSWFLRGNLLRDFAALNKVEMVPFLVRLANNQNWNSWRLVGCRDVDLGGDDWALLYKVGDLCLGPDARFEELRTLYESTPELRPPDEMINSGVPR